MRQRVSLYIYLYIDLAQRNTSKFGHSEQEKELCVTLEEFREFAIINFVFSLPHYHGVTSWLGQFVWNIDTRVAVELCGRLAAAVF